MLLLGPGPCVSCLLTTGYRFIHRNLFHCLTSKASLTWHLSPQRIQTSAPIHIPLNDLPLGSCSYSNHGINYPNGQTQVALAGDTGIWLDYYRSYHRFAPFIRLKDSCNLSPQILRYRLLSNHKDLTAITACLYDWKTLGDGFMLRILPTPIYPSQ